MIVAFRSLFINVLTILAISKVADVALDKLYCQNVVLDLERNVPAGRSCTVV
jgi:hypothetical protein